MSELSDEQFSSGVFGVTIASDHITAMKGSKTVTYFAAGPCGECPEIHPADPHYGEIAMAFEDVRAGRAQLGYFVELCFYGFECDELGILPSGVGLMKYISARLARLN